MDMGTSDLQGARSGLGCRTLEFCSNRYIAGALQGWVRRQSDPVLVGSARGPGLYRDTMRRQCTCISTRAHVCSLPSTLAGALGRLELTGGKVCASRRGKILSDSVEWVTSWSCNTQNLEYERTRHRDDQSTYGDSRESTCSHVNFFFFHSRLSRLGGSVPLPRHGEARFRRQQRPFQVRSQSIPIVPRLMGRTLLVFMWDVEAGAM